MTKIIKQRSLPSQIEEAEDHGGNGVNEREAGRGESSFAHLSQKRTEFSWGTVAKLIRAQSHPLSRKKRQKAWEKEEMKENQSGVESPSKIVELYFVQLRSFLEVKK